MIESLDRFGIPTPVTQRNSKVLDLPSTLQRWLTGIPLAVALTGCGGAASGLKSNYSMATGCPAAQVQVKPLGGDQYVASGCDGATIYQCTRSECRPQPEESSTKPIAAVVLVPASALLNTAASIQPRREKTKSGSLKLAVDIELERQASFQLSVEPEKPSNPLIVRLVYRDTEASLKDCDLGLLLNGQRIALPATRRQNKGIVTALSVDLTQTMIRELGTGQQVTIGACDKHFTLTSAQLSKLDQFATLFEEEIAWNGDPKTGKSSTLLAPAGGWLDWTITSEMPAAKTGGKELTGNDLFELLKPSVYKVEALLGDGTSQGSAVAVSATELLTNCHVVEGARKILIHQDKREFVAKLSRSRPSADRCVLTADGAAFTPVRGVRSYSDLKVGESLYTLGAPANLELSLSNGIVSGLRSDDPTGRFVQTTAPISPGSSGGGLFDSRGNLVGITTLVKVDRRRLNQSLNFAIAAEDFWQK